MGIFLLSSPSKVDFFFSGPTLSLTPYQTEKETLFFLLRQLQSNNMIQAHITIFTDSKMLISNINKLRNNLHDYNPAEIVYKLINSINLVFIDRDLNSQANSLAKEGLGRLSMITKWL